MFLLVFKRFLCYTIYTFRATYIHKERSPIMNTENLYTVTQITDYVIEKYKLSTDGADDSKKMTYRQQITRTLKNMELWNKAIIIRNGKRETRYFTEHQRQLLLAEPKFYDYVRTNSADKGLHEGKKYADIQRDITNRREAHLEYLDSLDMNENEDIPYISNKMLRKVRNDIMLKALFELFFTQFDETLLLNDLYQTQLLADELALEPIDIEAEHRLTHPEGNYYTKKENPFEEKQPSSKKVKKK